MTGVPLPYRRGIGLLGGTFDPIHNGHLAIAEEALGSLGLLEVDFLPASRPWQKSVLTSVTDRVRMIQVAIAGRPRLRVNLEEVYRPGLTYTIDTLVSLRKKAGPYMPLVLLMGFDQWTNLTTWRSWELLGDYADIAVFTRTGRGRAGAEPAALRAWSDGRVVSPELCTSAPCGLVSFFPMAPHAASSTEIRAILSGASTASGTAKLEGWLPAGVLRYINQHGLYRPRQ